uniref:Piwi domain-containing protein n=1 Tax=Branchiostoma floridae TaxID=7739 RepID=C3XV23_BRAFL|eukprot:XP_002611940.1 hypothetical protein BRAFLDRAFT_91824 [Branchiostoma floridae]
MARTQKNKATSAHLGLLKARLAKLRRELIEPKGGGGGKAGEGFDVAKTGDARIGFVGFPWVGKSTLLSNLCACFRFPLRGPKITFIIVKKRINTRFFARAGPGLQNPPPGTIVDDEVTRPEWYDYFLVSQSVRQGTVTPCHYNVVWDTSGLKPDHIQRLTYKLCHLYYNWPGTIRVPAPCQYAHKLAFLVGQSIHTSPSENLAQTLFFLRLRQTYQTARNARNGVYAVRNGGLDAIDGVSGGVRDGPNAGSDGVWDGSDGVWNGLWDGSDGVWDGLDGVWDGPRRRLGRALGRLRRRLDRVRRHRRAIQTAALGSGMGSGTDQ